MNSARSALSWLACPVNNYPIVCRHEVGGLFNQSVVAFDIWLEEHSWRIRMPGISDLPVLIYDGVLLVQSQRPKIRTPTKPNQVFHNEVNMASSEIIQCKSKTILEKSWLHANSIWTRVDGVVQFTFIEIDVPFSEPPLEAHVDADWRYKKC